jgi:hypothetical protein
VCEGELAGVICKLLTCKAVVEEVTLATCDHTTIKARKTNRRNGIMSMICSNLSPFERDQQDKNGS